MRLKRKVFIIFLLLLACLFIHIYSLNETRVEYRYSQGFFPALSRLLRGFFGDVTISIGDIFYGLLSIWLIWQVLLFFTQFIKNKGIIVKDIMLLALYRLSVFLCIMYIFFNTLWGINYNRKGIAWQLGLQMEKYSSVELKEINCLLIDKINTSKRELIASDFNYTSSADMFSMTANAYNKIAKQFSFLKYEKNSLKSSVWGWLGNYTGFTGYYNPFTGEAQVNTSVPYFLQPYIACHEVAHQLGYAKEMEANFVGYLAASASDDILFHYSVYLDLFLYANRNLYFVDSTTAKIYRKDLDSTVIKDLDTWRRFNLKHKNPVEPVIRWIYGKYLQGNKQPQGILSYDEVTAFIIAYYKKYGRL